RFHPVTAMRGVRVSERNADLELETDEGPLLFGRVTFPAPHVVRFKRAFGAEPGAQLTLMLVAEPERLPLTVDDGEGDVTIRAAAGGPALTLQRAPWRLTFGTYTTEPDDG